MPPRKPAWLTDGRCWARTSDLLLVRPEAGLPLEAGCAAIGGFSRRFLSAIPKKCGASVGSLVDWLLTSSDTERRNDEQRRSSERGARSTCEAAGEQGRTHQVRRGSDAARTDQVGGDGGGPSLAPLPPQAAPEHFEARLRRIEAAISTMAWWLVQAQTGFNQNDARGIDDRLFGKDREFAQPEAEGHADA